MIKLQHIKIGYNKCFASFGNQVLHWQKGELVGLVGDNGTGKSTFLKTLAGLIKPFDGVIEINNAPSDAIEANAYAKLVACVFTKPVKNNICTVTEYLSLSRLPHMHFNFKLSEHDLNLISESLKTLGIEAFAHQKINHLSDGEFQKVQLAACLVQDTPIILLDEPSSFLDYRSTKNLYVLLRKITSEKAKTVVVSSHDLEALVPYCDKIVDFNTTPIQEILPKDFIYDKN